MTVRGQMRYQPYYCEENIWWLCAEPPPGASIAQVIFVGSASGACPIAEQRAGGADGLVWWDYHCIGLDHERRVWDLDSRLPLPVPASTWLDRSFPRAAELSTQRQPGFRVVSSADYLQGFRSDRRHMRSSDGGWLHPPPPWPCIGVDRSAPVSNLAAFCDLVAAEGPGQLFDLEGFAGRFA